MSSFKLIGKKTKEVINKVDAPTKENAIQYFAKVKNLTIDMLLSIYTVEKN
jgi:hypothetical protein